MNTSWANRRALPAALLSALFVFAASCGTQQAGLNMVKIETSVARTVKSSLGFPYVTVDCPSSRAIKRGDHFTCAVSASLIDVTPSTLPGGISLPTEAPPPLATTTTPFVTLPDDVTLPTLTPSTSNPLEFRFQADVTQLDNRGHVHFVIRATHSP
jgi:hypothetical protein